LITLISKGSSGVRVSHPTKRNDSTPIRWIDLSHTCGERRVDCLEKWLRSYLQHQTAICLGQDSFTRRRNKFDVFQGRVPVNQSSSSEGIR
jgi:hypothetical protein